MINRHPFIDYTAMNKQQLIELLQDVAGALNTEEMGEDLVEVALNAYKAEQELASIKRKEDEAEQFMDNGRNLGGKQLTEDN